MRWTHITLKVRELDRSIAFYKKYCQLKVVRDRRHEGGDTVWLGLSTDDDSHPVFVIVLAVCEQDELSPINHLGFQCDTREEVDRVADLARSNEIAVIGPQDAGDVIGYWTMFPDPDGNQVEFTHGQPIAGLRC